MSIKIFCPHCENQVKELFGSLNHIWEAVKLGGSFAVDKLLEGQESGTKIYLHWDEVHTQEGCNKKYRISFKRSMLEDGTLSETTLEVTKL